jgi:type IV pilus assembly protein PilE
MRRQFGFTLIELMIVILIIAVLASIAIPTYQSQIRKGRRTEAKSAVLDLAGREERFYAANNVYSSTETDLGYATGAFGTPIGSGYYSVGVNVPAANKNSFTVTATVVGSSPQATDTSCVNFSIDNFGQRKANDGGADTTSTCW